MTSPDLLRDPTDHPMRVVADAVSYAAAAHDGHVRKGSGVPYLTHLLAVTTLVLEHGGTAEQAAAGVLHDVVEDQGGQARLDHVRDTFGPTIAQMVDDLSDAAPAPGQAKAPWEQRKRDYLQHARQLVAAGSPAALVSLADKTHNAEAIIADGHDPQIGAAIFDRFKATREQTLWYYRELDGIFADSDLPDRLVARFAAAVEQMGRIVR